MLNFFFLFTEIFYLVALRVRHSNPPVFKTLREICHQLGHGGFHDWINIGVARNNYLKSPNNSGIIGLCAALQRDAVTLHRQLFLPATLLSFRVFIPSCNISLVFNL